MPAPGQLAHIMMRGGGALSQRDNSLRTKCQMRNSLFVCCAFYPFFLLFFEGRGVKNDWQAVIAQNCPANTHFLSLEIFFFFLFLESPLTGQAKLKGKTILDLSFLTELLKEKVFPPRTGVDPIPKLQGPAAETLDWYSFRQTLKNVLHSSRVHFLSAPLRAPSQHTPLSSSPFALRIDKICNSNCPDPSDTCWRQKSECNGTVCGGD